MFHTMKRLSLVLLAFVLTLTMLNMMSFASPKAYAAQNDGSTVHGVRLASPAVVRIITLIEGQVIVTLSDGTLTFPLDGSTYQLVASGSGAFISPDGYVLTADHVVDFPQNDTTMMTQYLQLAIDEYAKAAQVTQEEAVQVFNQLISEGRVRVPYQVTQQKVFLSTAYTGSLTNVAEVNGYTVTRIVANSSPDKQDVAIIKIEAKDMPFLALATASSIQVQDSITAVAFPADADTSSAFWALLDSTHSDINTLSGLLTASVETGQITAEKKLSDGTLVYETNNIASHGSSGGPVINNEGQIVGFVDAGSATQRVVFLIPSDVVVSYAKQAGITGSEKGTFMSQWTKAIDAYDATGAGHWTQASQYLRQLHDTYPAVGGIEPLLQTAQEKAKTEPAQVPHQQGGGQSLTMWLLIGGGALLLLVIGGTLFFVFARRKPKQPLPAGPGTAAPVNAPPYMPPAMPAAPVGAPPSMLASTSDARGGASPARTPIPAMPASYDGSTSPVSPGIPASTGQGMQAGSSQGAHVAGAGSPAVVQPAMPTIRVCTAGHIVSDPRAHFCPECGALIQVAPREPTTV